MKLSVGPQAQALADGVLSRPEPLRSAGVQGAGLGSSLYVPGMPLDELGRRARRLLTAWAESPVKA